MRLADLVDERGITYGVVQPGRAVPDGTPILRVANFSGGTLATDDVLRIDPEIARRFTRSRLVGGEVLITLVGSVGQVAIAPFGLAGWNVARAVGVIPVRTQETATWVAQCLRAPSIQAGLAERFNTTVQTTLNLKDLAACEIPFPPASEQRAIASVLGALDDKIESNRRLADGSDAVWLAYGAHRAADAESRLVADLIAEGSLVVNDGYRAKNSQLADEGIPFLRAGNLTSNGLDVSGADRVPPETVAKAGMKVSRPWDTAFTSKGTVGRMTLIQPGADPGVYSPQICFWRTTDDAVLSPFALHAWMRSARFVAQVDAVKGQTDMADYVSLRDQRAMTIEVPSIEAQREITALAQPLASRAASLRAEARTLTALRDALLPKLVSGQIRVPPSADPEDGLDQAVDAVNRAP